MESQQITNENQNKIHQFLPSPLGEDKNPLIGALSIKVENEIIVFIKTGIQMCNILLSLLYYHLQGQEDFEDQVYNTLIEFGRNFIINDQEWWLVSLSYILTFLIFQNIIFHSLLQSKCSNLLAYFNHNIHKALSILIQINILLASLLFFSDHFFILKTVGFAAIALISIYADIFLQCISNPKDFLHTNHPEFMIIVRVSTMSLLAISFIGFSYGIKLALFGISAFLFVVVYVTFKMFGYRAYLHKSSKILLQGTVALFLSVCITIFIEQLTFCQSLNLPLLFVAMMADLCGFFGNRTYYFQDIKVLKIADIKQLFEIFALNRDGDWGENKVFMVGLEHLHIMSQCQNQSCFSHKKEIFCYEEEVSLQIGKISIDEHFEVMAKNLLKCLMQQLMRTQASNMEVLLFYCEFCFNEMENMLAPSLYIQKIKPSNLSLYQQMRLFNLKKRMGQDINKTKFFNFNHLHIEQIIKADESIDCLNQKLYQIIEINKKIWQKLTLNSLSIHRMLKMIREVEKRRQLINKKLQQIDRYINISSKLKRIVAIYQLYINNDAKRQRQIKALHQALNSSSIEHNEQRIRESMTKRDLFGNNSVIIHTYHDGNGLIIKKCSKSISSILGYGQEDLIGSDISTIMPEYFRNYHRQRFLNWIDYGMINLEKFDQGVEVYALDKCQRFLSVMKVFKIYVNQDGLFEYVCLLKKINNKSRLAIVNEQFEIQGISENFLEIFYAEDKDQFRQQASSYIKSVFQSFDESVDPMMRQSFSVKIHEKPFAVEVRQVRYSTKKRYSIAFMSTIPKITKSGRQLNITEEVIGPAIFQLPQKLKSSNQPLKNIFMKQNVHMPRTEMKELRLMRCSLLILSIFMVGMFVGMLAIFSITFSRLEYYIDQQSLMTKFTKDPYILGIEYYKSIMNIDEQDQVNNLIHIYTEEYLNIVEDSQFLLTVFQNNLFPTVYLSVPGNEGSGSSQFLEGKDAIFSISSAISSFRNISFLQNSSEFSNFNKLLLPVYEIISVAQAQLHNTYTQIFADIKIPSIIVLCSECGFFVVVGIVFCMGYHKLRNKLREIMEILMVPCNVDRELIQKYWSRLKCLHLLFNNRDCVDTEQHECAIRHKSVKAGVQLTKNQYKICAIIVISLLLIISPILVFEVANIRNLRGLQQFEALGQYYLGSYPAGAVLSYALMQKYYNETVLNITESTASFALPLQKMRHLSNIQYIAGSDPNSLFLTTLKNYFFSNPCIQNPMVYLNLNVTEEECSVFGSGRIISGIVPFEREMESVISSLLLNSSAALTADELINVTQSMAVMSAYIEDLLTIWSSQFVGRVQNVKESSIHYSIILICIIIPVYYILLQKSFISKVNGYYKEYVRAYDMLMPKDTIEKDKIILSKLISYNFLTK